MAAGLAVALAVLNPQLFRANRSHWKFLLAFGFVLSIFNTLWTVAVATVLAYNSPAFTALLAWRLFRGAVVTGQDHRDIALDGWLHPGGRRVRSGCMASQPAGDRGVTAQR